MCCLRVMNNNASVIVREDNPTVDGKGKKPIVEFAVENNLVLRRRDEKMRKLKEKERETTSSGGVESRDTPRPRTAPSSSGVDRREAPRTWQTSNSARESTWRNDDSRKGQSATQSRDRPVAMKRKAADESSSTTKKGKFENSEDWQNKGGSDFSSKDQSQKAPKSIKAKGPRDDKETKNFDSLVSNFKKNIFGVQSESRKADAKKWYE